jgi:hypothetical protein
VVLSGSKSPNGWSCYFKAVRVAGTALLGWVFTRIASSSGIARAVVKIPTGVDVV